MVNIVATWENGPIRVEYTYLFEVVKKLSMVVTPSVTRAGSAFHSIQNVTKDEVTRIMPRKTLIYEHPYNTQPWSVHLYFNVPVSTTLTWHEDCGVVEPLVPREVQPHLEAAVVPLTSNIVDLRIRDCHSS